MEKSYVSFFSSSHGTGRHHFPGFFNDLIWNSRARFHWPPRNYSRGGKRMTVREKNLVISVARQISPAKHHVILNLGTNNVRDGVYSEDLLPFFKEIAEELGSIPNCHLILVSLVPSFARNEELKNEFWRLSQSFKAMAQLYPHVTWCNWVRQLFWNGELDHQCFEDDVHLSPMGAEIFANAIFRSLSYSPKNN